MLKTGGVPFGSRRYRHTKLTAPDPNSKSYERKSKQRQKAIKAGEAVPEFPNKNKRARSELKSGSQIQKQRNEKEKRRQKTGRHFLAKNKKRK